MMRRLTIVLPLWLIAGCGAGVAPPAALDAANEQCRFCRMAVSEQRFAAQLVAPREEPLFFDDLGCLRAFLEGQPSLPAGTVAYVADHRTKAWLRAEAAIYTRNDAVATPMGSHTIAHESIDSRDGDSAARGGRLVPFAEMFPVAPPGGKR
jgi:copper chaperone NosL